MTRSVALVGAGPGDPELLTLAAEGLLRLAAAVVVDASVVALAEAFSPHADVVTVRDGVPAADDLLAAAGRALGPVVRLYRGDPWLHPAYQSERARLEGVGVHVEAVPGVAVEVALPALAGIPLHVRHLAAACTLGTAGTLPAADDPARTLVASGGTATALVRSTAGDPTMPSALVPLDHAASTWCGPLGAAGEQAGSMAGPALLVTGAVCGARGDAAGSRRNGAGATSRGVSAPAADPPLVVVRGRGRADEAADPVADRGGAPADAVTPSARERPAAGGGHGAGRGGPPRGGAAPGRGGRSGGVAPAGGWGS